MSEVQERPDPAKVDKPFWRGRPWIWAVIFLGICLFFYASRTILFPFIVGALIAYFLNPLTTALAPKIGRTGGALQSLILFFAVFIFALLGVIPFIKAEFLELSRRLPLYFEQAYSYLQPFLKEWDIPIDQSNLASLSPSVQQNFSALLSWGLRFLANFFSGTVAVANLLSLIVITPIVAFYFLRDWPLIIKSLNELLPRRGAPVLRELLVKINTVLGGYARGQLMVCSVLAVYYAVALKIIGLHYAVTIGLIAGFFAFIPYVGFLVGTVAAFGMALSQFSDWKMFAILGGVFLVGQAFESYILLPKLIGNRVQLHPVWILFALLTGGVFFGFLGLLIAMPVAAAVGVIIRHLVQAYKNSGHAAGSETVQK